VEEEEARLYAAHPDLPPSSELNVRLHAQYIASTELLATTTGADAVERMLYSHRIQVMVCFRLQYAAWQVWPSMLSMSPGGPAGCCAEARGNRRIRIQRSRARVCQLSNPK
jgi:hypothetical protein